MIKAIIIDNEPQSRNLLRTILVDYCKELIVSGEAEDVNSGIALLRKQQADVILLSIRLPGGNGFDILNVFDHAKLNIIFLADDVQDAIKAIKYAPLDYLLKPIDPKELQLAIQKLRKDPSIEQNQLSMLASPTEQQKKRLRQIILPGRDSHIVIELEHIIRIEARGSYVMIYLEANKTHLVVNSLSYYENILPTDKFFRIHKSHLINISKVKRFVLGRRSKVLLDDGTELDIAARRKSAFSKFFKQLGKT